MILQYYFIKKGIISSLISKYYLYSQFYSVFLGDNLTDAGEENIKAVEFGTPKWAE